jgi:hypothetical protein
MGCSGDLEKQENITPALAVRFQMMGDHTTID